jgi:hypothetical protein
MAKNSYSIPPAINRTWLDHEIGISGGGWDLRPTPLRQILFFLGGGMLLAWVCMKTFVASAGAPMIVAVIVWWLVCLVYFGGLDKTKELKVQRVPALLAYLPRRARRLIARRSSDPSDFYSVVGIYDIEDDGLIHFDDKSKGQIYLVVGSASYLLFDEDKTSILDHVDAFWRKTDSGCEWAFITTKEPQRVHRQVVSLERDNQALEIRDPELIELQNEKYDIITQHVGGRFTSIHQYVLLRGKSMDALRRGQQLLQAEVEGSVLMIKEATVLDRTETLTMLKIFYQEAYQQSLSARMRLVA